MEAITVMAKPMARLAVMMFTSMNTRLVSMFTASRPVMECRAIHVMVGKLV
jgi:hypothetical protein